jgi:hypothetical protein
MISKRKISYLHYIVFPYFIFCCLVPDWQQYLIRNYLSWSDDHWRGANLMRYCLHNLGKTVVVDAHNLRNNSIFSCLLGGLIHDCFPGANSF